MILTVAIPTPLRRLFDYLPPKDGSKPAPGVRVKVPFGNRTLVGLVVGTRDSSALPADKLKSVAAVIDSEPLVPKKLLQLFLWAAAYYQHPVGDALFTTLPSPLRKGEALPLFQREHWRLTNRGAGRHRPKKGQETAGAGATVAPGARRRH